MAAKHFMAGSVPRFIRQTKLGYLPLNYLIGSRIMRGGDGVNLIMDIIMLPAPDLPPPEEPGSPFSLAALACIVGTK